MKMLNVALLTLLVTVFIDPSIADEAVAFPGTIYVFQPNLGLTGGGTASLHEIHHELRRQGFRTKMFRVNEKYASVLSVRMDDEEIGRLFSEGLQAHDTLLVPELAEFGSSRVSGDEAIRFLESNGGLIVRWIMGMHPHFLAPDPRFVHASSSAYIQRQYLVPGLRPLMAPLDPLIYEASQTSPEGGWRCHKSVSEDLIVIDDDSSLSAEDIAYLAALLNQVRKERIVAATSFDLTTGKEEEEAATPALSARPIEVVEFRGFSRRETIDLYARAKIFLDLHHPGRERSNYEFALFDALPVIVPLINGGDEVDFPNVPRAYYSCNDTFLGLANTVLDVLDSYDALLDRNRCQGITQLRDVGQKGPDARQRSIFSAYSPQHMKTKARRMATEFRGALGPFVRSRHLHFVVPVLSVMDFVLLAPTLTSALVTHPLATVTVLCAFKLRGAKEYGAGVKSPRNQTTYSSSSSSSSSSSTASDGAMDAIFTHWITQYSGVGFLELLKRVGLRKQVTFRFWERCFDYGVDLDLDESGGHVENLAIEALHEAGAFGRATGGAGSHPAYTNRSILAVLRAGTVMLSDDITTQSGFAKDSNIQLGTARLKPQNDRFFGAVSLAGVDPVVVALNQPMHRIVRRRDSNSTTGPPFDAQFDTTAAPRSARPTVVVDRKNLLPHEEQTPPFVSIRRRWDVGRSTGQYYEGPRGRLTRTLLRDHSLWKAASIFFTSFAQTRLAELGLLPWQLSNYEIELNGTDKESSQTCGVGGGRKRGRGSECGRGLAANGIGDHDDASQNFAKPSPPPPTPPPTTTVTATMTMKNKLESSGDKEGDFSTRPFDVIMPFNDIEHRINSNRSARCSPCTFGVQRRLTSLPRINQSTRDADNDDNDGDEDDDSSDSDPLQLCVAQVGWRRQIPSKGYNEAPAIPLFGFVCVVIPPDANLTSVVDVDVTLHFMPLTNGGEWVLFAWVENTDQSRRLSAVRARAVTLPTPSRTSTATDPAHAFDTFTFDEMLVLRKIFDRRPLLVALQDKVQARRAAAKKGVPAAKLLIAPSVSVADLQAFWGRAETNFTIELNHWRGDQCDAVSETYTTLDGLRESSRTELHVFHGGREVGQDATRDEDNTSTASSAVTSVHSWLGRVPLFARSAMEQVETLLQQSTIHRQELCEWAVGRVSPRLALIQELRRSPTVQRGSEATNQHYFKCHCFRGRSWFVESDQDGARKLFDRDGAQLPWTMQCASFRSERQELPQNRGGLSSGDWEALVRNCEALADPLIDYLRVDLLHTTQIDEKQEQHKKVKHTGSSHISSAPSQFLFSQFVLYPECEKNRKDRTLDFTMAALWRSANPPWRNEFLASWGTTQA